jgi:uroporphyrinogen decarboxylase
MASSRDLIHNLLTNTGAVDRVGIYEHFWRETPTTWIEQGYPTCTTVEEGNKVVKPENPALHFGFDMLRCGGSFDVDPIQGYGEVLEQTDEWIIRRNGAGAALKYWKHKSGTPEHIDFLMTSREIWERDYRPHLLQVDSRRLESGNWKRTTLQDDKALLEAGRANNLWTFYGHIFIWETMRQSMGDYVMYQNLILDPGWVQDFNRVYTDFFKAHFEILFVELGKPDGIWIYEDLGYKNGLFASPRMLQSLFFPYFAELVDFFHSYGLPVVLHSCGNITQALPLIVEAGFDALQPMEVKAGCDPFAFAEQYGEALAFIGGFDVRFLETNDRDTIERQVTRLVEGMKSRGARYVFHSDHSITPLVNYDSYRCALDAYRKCMML